MRRGRIIVVDDSAAMRKEVAAILASAPDLEVVAECGDGLSALRAMAEKNPDAVLCDLLMPSCDGMQFLRLKAARPELESMPVIMLTSSVDPDRKVQLLESGAADYITKPFHAGELLARVRVHVRLRTLQQQLKEANDRLYELSCTDGLTTVFNRRHFDAALNAEMARHYRYGTPLSILLIDIDHFKRVNDVYGHATGDNVLKNIALLLKALVRRADVVARVGGEEFAVIMPNSDASAALILAERLRASICALEHTAPDCSIRVTASFGVGATQGKEPELDSASLLSRADQALYSAKHAGRDRIVFWTKKIAEAATSTR